MKTEQASAAVEATKTETSKKVQITIETLRELAANPKLLTAFEGIVKEGIKSDMAIVIARREVKQLELEVK